MAVISIKSTHILKVDDHSVTSEDCADDNRYDSCLFYFDTCFPSNLHILTYSPHILTKLCFFEPKDKDTEKCNKNECSERNAYTSYLERDKVIEALSDTDKVYSVSYTISTWKKNFTLDWDDEAHHKEYYQLVNTIYKEADDIRCDHLSSLCKVQYLSTPPTKENRDRCADNGSKNHSRDAYNTPLCNEYKTNLTCHGTKSHTEVKTHTCHNRNQKGYDKEAVSTESCHHFIHYCCSGEAGKNNTDSAYHNEHDRNHIIKKECTCFLS